MPVAFKELIVGISGGIHAQGTMQLSTMVLQCHQIVYRKSYPSFHYNNSPTSTNCAYETDPIFMMLATLRSRSMSSIPTGPTPWTSTWACWRTSTALLPHQLHLKCLLVLGRNTWRNMVRERGSFDHVCTSHFSLPPCVPPSPYFSNHNPRDGSVRRHSCL